MSGPEKVREVAQPSSRQGPIASQLIGVWSLVAYTDEREGREGSHPFGSKPEGYLIYTPEGFVSAQLMKTGRSLFQSSAWHRGTPEEYREAGSGYVQRKTMTQTLAKKTRPIVLGALTRAITRGDLSVFNRFWAEDYIQHNLLGGSRSWNYVSH